jgi:hypothetical protein
MTGELTRKLFTARASASVYLSGASLAAADLCQALVKYKEYGCPDYAGQLAYGLLGLGGFVPLSAAFVASTLPLIEYFNGSAKATKIVSPPLPNQNDLVVNTFDEPTVTIDKNGITLFNGTSSIVLKSDEIQIRAKKLTIGIGDEPDDPIPEQALEFSKNGLSISAEAIVLYTDQDISISAGSKFEADAPDIIAHGSVLLKNDLTVTDNITAKKFVKAQNVQAN